MRRLLFALAVLCAASEAAHAQVTELQDNTSGKCWTAAGDFVGSLMSLAPCDGSMNQRFITAAMPSQSGKDFLWFDDGSWQYCVQATQPLHLDACWDNAASPQGFTVNSDGSISYGSQSVIFGSDGNATLYTPPPYVPPEYTFVTQPAPPGDFAPSGYTQVAGDEFAEANLDTTKWWTRGSYSGGTQQFMNTGEVGRYSESGNHVMTGSTLKLTALPVGSAGAGLYATGAIRSKFTLPLASGSGYYVAVRAKVPNGKGTHVAAWLAPDDRGTVPSWPPELGGMEILTNATMTTEQIGLDIQSNGSSAFNAAVTSDQGANFTTQWNFWWAPFNADQDFHVYGLWYKNGQWAQTVDGVAVSHGSYNWVYDASTPANAASIICNFDIGGPVAGTAGIDDSKFPQAYEIDYVRVYAEPGAPTLGVSTIGQDLMPPSGG